MKKNYTFYSALLLGLLGFQGIHAQGAETNVERIKQVLTFGDWEDAGKELGIDTKNIPTQVKDYFYNNRGMLVKTLEGDFLLTDAPETILKTEKYGDIKPTKYTTYGYDENNRLTSITESKYQTANGWFFNWSANDTICVNKYDAQGKLESKSDKNYQYHYTWKGEQLTVAKQVAKNGAKESVVTYFSDFVAENSNCPKKAIEVAGEKAYYIVNEYDENLHLLQSSKYNLTNPVKGEDGNIVDGEKGEACWQKTYTYDKDRMTVEVTSVWDATNNKFAAAEKKESLWNETKKGYETIAYHFENGNWNADANATVECMGHYELGEEVGEVSVKEFGAKANSVLVSFTAPQNSKSDTKWNVFRNGVLLGHANLLENRWEYYDNEVANGSYDYYVMADTLNNPGDKTITNVASLSFNTEGEKVEEIRVIESGKNVTVDNNGESKTTYVYRLAWKAPKTTKTIMGYNVYLNADPTQKGVKPHNTKLLTTPFYDLTINNSNKLENNVIVEVVYHTGYAESAPEKITLNPAAEINKNSLSHVQKVVTYGSSMGDVDIATPSKEVVNYYDADNRLVMSVTNGYLRGDDPDTHDIVEKAGDYMPVNYSVYEYDEQGKLLTEKSCEYGVFSGYDRAWSKDFKTLAAYKYNEAGQIIRKDEMSKAYEYDWEGENIVTERIFTTRGNGLLGRITYSDFSDKGKNLPKYGLGVSMNQYSQNYNRVYEFDYDEKGRIIEKRTYKHGENAEKDDNGIIVKVDKGVLHEKLIYEYEGEMLKSTIKYTYKSSIKDIAPYSKVVYTQTAEGLRTQNYTYSDFGNTEGWTESSMQTNTVENTYLGNTAPTDFQIKEVEGKANCLLLTCKAPTKIYNENTIFEIYRNGKKLGEAKPDAKGKISYEDNLVPNGTWFYFIKACSNFEGVDYNSTQVIKQVLNTELPVVSKLTFPINGVKENGDYKLVAQWETPETDFEILGYNVFVDVRSFTKNPTPVNGLDELENNIHEYEFSWMSYVNPEKSIQIETVYPIGKAMSEKFNVVLSSEPVGIVTTETSKHLVAIGNRVLVNGAYDKLLVYGANGACVAQYSNTKSIDLAYLTNGVYIVKLVTPQGVETLKIVKR